MTDLVKEEKNKVRLLRLKISDLQELFHLINGPNRDVIKRQIYILQDELEEKLINLMKEEVC